MAEKLMRRIETCPGENIYFAEEQIEMNNMPARQERGLINVFDDVKYQEILGFGGSFTESTAYNYSLLSAEDKKRFIELFFDREKGIAYNFGRTHINSCDYSLSAYVSVQDGDKTLDTFNLERERKYIIPFLKDGIAYSKEEIVLFASPWSAPAYMKDNNSMFRGGKLLEEYKSVWAHYYAKYIKAMAAEGIKIGTITVQNEPNAIQTWESCEFTPEEEADFIDKYLIDALDEEGLGDIRIMIWDHNKERVYDRTKKVLANKRVSDRVWGVAHHWYAGSHFEGLRLVHEQFGKPLINGEMCGPISSDINHLAEEYGIEMCEDFNNFDVAFCDWNFILNEIGGPFHNRTHDDDDNPLERKHIGCYAPVMLDTKKNEMWVTPIYYYIGHFSKFVQRGAVRIATTKHSVELYSCAFENPDGSKVCIVINTSDEEQAAHIRYNDACTKNIVKPHSITTLIF